MHRKRCCWLLAASATAGGLAASLVLGADGVLVGTRQWASNEALVGKGHHRAILATDGDGTIRTMVADIARQVPWPRGFAARIRRNAFTARWHGCEDELDRNVRTKGPHYRQAFMDGDPEDTGVWFGEAAGLIRAIEPAGLVVERMSAEAARRPGPGTGIRPAGGTADERPTGRAVSPAGTSGRGAT
jgi:nitronate monooxygenase